jgi:hypothetical protein
MRIGIASSAELGHLATACALRALVQSTSRFAGQQQTWPHTSFPLIRRHQRQDPSAAAAHRGPPFGATLSIGVTAIVSSGGSGWSKPLRQPLTSCSMVNSAIKSPASGDCGIERGNWRQRRHPEAGEAAQEVLVSRVCSLMTLPAEDRIHHPTTNPTKLAASPDRLRRRLFRSDVRSTPSNRPT